MAEQETGYSSHRLAKIRWQSTGNLFDEPRCLDGSVRVWVTTNTILWSRLVA